MTDSERPWWRDRADEIERQVGMGKMDAAACYTQMVQLLDAERHAPAAPVPTEQQILDAAEKAGLIPNTVHAWIPAFKRYHAALSAAAPKP